MNIKSNREFDQLKTQIYGNMVSPAKTGSWTLDTSALKVTVDESTVFVPKYFLRYATISYAAAGAAETI